MEDITQLSALLVALVLLLANSLVAGARTDLLGSKIGCRGVDISPSMHCSLKSGKTKKPVKDANFTRDIINWGWNFHMTEDRYDFGQIETTFGCAMPWWWDKERADARFWGAIANPGEKDEFAVAIVGYRRFDGGRGVVNYTICDVSYWDYKANIVGTPAGDTFTCLCDKQIWKEPHPD